MRNLINNPDKIKAWKRASSLVLHSLIGPIEGTVAYCEAEIEELLDPDNFPTSGAWVPVVRDDTLHLIHPYFTACEGEA